MEGIRWFLGFAVAVVALIVSWMAWQHPKLPTLVSPGPSSAPAGINPLSSATPTATRHPVTTATSQPQGAKKLELDQLRVGDCLTGSNLELGKDNVDWPYLALSVPCTQAHTAEVFFANNGFWKNSNPFPGIKAMTNAAEPACEKAFNSYVGTSDLISQYSWIWIAPNTAADWQNGNRELYCVAWYKTSNQPEGAVLHASIRGTGE